MALRIATGIPEALWALVAQRSTIVIETNPEASL